MFRKWFRRVSPRRRRRRYCSAEARFVPRVEALEFRDLPSTLTVLKNADSGDSSLRAVLALASGWADQAMTKHAMIRYRRPAGVTPRGRSAFPG